MSIKDKIGYILGLCILIPIGLVGCLVTFVGMTDDPPAASDIIGGLVIAAFGFLLAYGNIRDLRSAAKQTNWKTVEPDATITAFNSQPIHRRRSKSFFVSTVEFSDGFKYMSTRTKYSNFIPSGLTSQSYRMGVDEEAICQEAQKAHDAAVRKKLRKLGGNK